jgi:hypothetical protein
VATIGDEEGEGTYISFKHIYCYRLLYKMKFIAAILGFTTILMGFER